MDQKQKEVHRKNQQSQENKHRFSQQFVYNPDFERHIGKRTGNYYGRVNPKQNYDGFPRFSEYQSHRNTDSSSLAKQLQNTNSVSVHATFNNNLQPQIEQPKPFQAKQSPIIVPLDSNNSSRIPETTLPGFGQFQISTIKRRSSGVRASQIKSYRELLNNLQEDQFKSFIFNDEEVKQIQQSAKKQKYKQEQELKARQMKKKKKETRVSFKQNPIQHLISQKQKRQSSGNINKAKIQTGNNLKLDNQQIQKIQQKNNNKRQEDIKEINKNKQQKIYYKRQEETQQQDAQFQYYSNKQFNYQDDIKQQLSNSNNRETNSNLNKEISKNQESKISYRRGKQKQMRITDSPQRQHNDKNQQEQDNYAKKQQKIQKNKKKQVKISQKQNAHKSKQKISNRSTKVRIRSKQKQYIQQLASQKQENQQNKRYPKRTRIKPVQYWQNQKVHYKAGKAIGIQRTVSLDIKQLLNTKQNYDNIINVNFHTHDIQVQLLIPPKKSLQSNGFKDNYQQLQIQIGQKSHKNVVQVYYEDGIRSVKLKVGQKVVASPLQHFQIQNSSKIAVYLHLKLKVKI